MFWAVKERQPLEGTAFLVVWLSGSRALLRGWQGAGQPHGCAALTCSSRRRLPPPERDGAKRVYSARLRIMRTISAAAASATIASAGSETSAAPVLGETFSSSTAGSGVGVGTGVTTGDSS